ncbi:transcriptional regulator swi6 [Irineochytrium annulatum]|nr:transcriptional regulator swi6 [Irineochytrium annulatum]
MRRVNDSFVNATQVLRSAGLAKTVRTKILERDIAPGVHEKIQGGYHMFQGTWVPLDSAIYLAREHGVYAELATLFTFDMPTDGSAFDQLKAAKSAPKPPKPRPPKPAPQPQQRVRDWSSELSDDDGQLGGPSGSRLEIPSLSRVRPDGRPSRRGGPRGSSAALSDSQESTNAPPIAAPRPIDPVTGLPIPRKRGRPKGSGRLNSPSPSLLQQQLKRPKVPRPPRTLADMSVSLSTILSDVAKMRAGGGGGAKGPRSPGTPPDIELQLMDPYGGGGDWRNALGASGGRGNGALDGDRDLYRVSDYGSVSSSESNDEAAAVGAPIQLRYRGGMRKRARVDRGTSAPVIGASGSAAESGTANDSSGGSVPGGGGLPGLGVKRRKGTPSRWRCEYCGAKRARKVAGGATLCDGCSLRWCLGQLPVGPVNAAGAAEDEYMEADVGLMRDVKDSDVPIRDGPGGMTMGVDVPQGPGTGLGAAPVGDVSETTAALRDKVAALKARLNSVEKSRGVLRRVVEDVKRGDAAVDRAWRRAIVRCRKAKAEIRSRAGSLEAMEEEQDVGTVAEGMMVDDNEESSETENMERESIWRFVTAVKTRNEPSAAVSV